jgi:hypothetical protein
LHIAASAALGKNAAVIAAFHHDGPVSVQPAMDVHAASGVVHRGDSSVGPLDN